MTDTLIHAPCVLFTLRRESRAFRRLFPAHQLFPGAPCWLCFCGPPPLTVLVGETGIGSQATRQALEWLLGQPRLGEEAYRPRVVISAGFAGALEEGLAVGDLLLATDIADLRGNCWPTIWPGELSPPSWQPPPHRGRLLTCSQLVTTVREKRLLGQQHRALAVDMESALVAQLCCQHQVPFACLRSISDDAHTSLSPRLTALLSGGRVSPWRLAMNLLCSPFLVGELVQLARQTKLASERLGLALEKLLAH